MGYVFTFQDAKAYDTWFKKSRNRFAANLETSLMLNLINPNRGETILDIGCGTGFSLIPFLDKGLQVTGLDPSPYMIDLAEKKVKNRVDFYRGFAEDLPFDDNSFNYASFFTTLEFVENPRKAIEEACRVAKDLVFIGVLNRFAIKAIQRRIKGMSGKTIYNKARFFSVWEIKSLLCSILGDVPISWRTVIQIPSSPNKFLNTLEYSPFVQRSPFGAFAGITAAPVPRFTTDPLSLKYQTKPATSASSGFSGAIRRQ